MAQPVDEISLNAFSFLDNEVVVVTLQHENVSSVHEALDQMVSREALHGLICPKTKQEVEASRRYMLETLPPVLILHLKWFVYDKSGGCQKIAFSRRDGSSH